MKPGLKPGRDSSTGSGERTGTAALRRKGRSRTAMVRTNEAWPRSFRSLTPLWERWTQIIALFALQRTQRKNVKRQEYEQLHRELLAECQRLEQEHEDH